MGEGGKAGLLFLKSGLQLVSRYLSNPRQITDIDFHEFIRLIPTYKNKWLKVLSL